MITEHDLAEAIAECEGQKNPNSNTCIKLAAFYTIRDHLYPKMDVKIPEPQVAYSRAVGPESKEIYDSGSEFSDIARGLSPGRVMEVMDELMETLSVVNPRLYDGVIRKLEE